MKITLEEIINPVGENMAEFEAFFLESLNASSPLLNDVLSYIFERKGKRIRPLLTVLSAMATMGKTNQNTFAGASVVELIHTATLVHDDVVDNSAERRGQKSINNSWDSKVAVLVGDFLLAQAMTLTTKYEIFEILKVITKPVSDMSEGELMQIERAGNVDVSEKSYFEIIEKKTASLISAAMATGAISVDASLEKIKLVADVGTFIGIAFQIRDDIFDLEKTNKTGKPSGNDIIEKKITLPLIYSLSQSNQQKKVEIIDLVIASEKHPENIDIIRNFIIEKKGIEYAEKIAFEYSNKAINMLSDLDDSKYTRSLKMLCEYVVNRNN